MASYQHGPLGPFRGKLGLVVGSSWKGIPNLRSRPKKRSKPSTAKQKKSQSALSFMSKWLAPINQLVMIGFHHYDPTITGRMAAHSYNANNALIKSGEELAIDYSKALFSYGSMPGADSASAELTNGNTLLITWNTQVKQGSRKTDILLHMIYFPELGTAEYGIGEYSRKDGQMLFKIPPEKQGYRMEVMIAFKSIIDEGISTSQYLGAILPDGSSGTSERSQYCLPLSVEGLFKARKT